MHDPGDEDDGDLKREAAALKEWIRSQRFQPMMWPWNEILAMEAELWQRLEATHEDLILR